MASTSRRERARDPRRGRPANSAARSDTTLPVVHFHRPVERPFTASQRDSTTVLIGGLSPRHDRLVEAAIQAMGCRCRALPNVTLESYTAGREFGNNGLCNPTYFTVGNLVKFLQDLEADGMSKQEIIDSYVFLTAGSCGTCRFGMYESQYRLALENAGFHGFRVILFGTDDGIDQSSGEAAGLDLSLDFFLGLITAFDLADVLNQYTYRLRPYEAVPGSVDEVAARVVAHLHDLIRHRDRYELEDHWTRFALGTRLEGVARYAAKIWHLTHSDQFTGAMREARDAFDALEYDPFRVKPIVKLMGEFWAQTTEGPGNFHIHRFLEQEGAEIYVDRSLFTRLSYMLFMHREKTRDRRGLRGAEGRLGHYLRYYRKMGLLGLADRLLHRENRRLIEALGGTLHEMLDQNELERLARPYWNWRTTSGEGHLEIAENIYYHSHDLCHMVLSVKPFSCMPSTQSDGVQVRVVEDHPGMIFLPIETSGDGEVIAHSRVQMALGSARAKARKEMDDVIAASPWTLTEIRDWADDHPEVQGASYRVPHAPGVVGRAANLALHVSSLMEARAPVVSVPREVHHA